MYKTIHKELNIISQHKKVVEALTEQNFLFIGDSLYQIQIIHIPIDEENMKEKY